MKFGFLIDHRKCIGCHACSVACKEEHQVPLGVYRTWVKYVEKGEFPHTQRHFTVLRCNHCEYALCVPICPVTALYKHPDGIVDFDADVCIGCKACMQACPYDALYIDPNTNTAAKCNFCAHRVEVGLQPSCEVVCPTQAILSGDLDDPTSTIAQTTTRAPVRVRKPEKGTVPQLLYIDADENSLTPSATSQAQDFGMWSQVAKPEITDTSLPLPGFGGMLSGAAKGRDFWLSPALPVHLLAQALLAGAAALAIVDVGVRSNAATAHLLHDVLLWSLLANLFIMLVGELWMPHGTRDAAQAARMMLRGAYCKLFWGMVVGLGHGVPVLLLVLVPGAPLVVSLLVGGSALVGLLVFEHLWLMAGQAAPLS